MTNKFIETARKEAKELAASWEFFETPTSEKECSLDQAICAALKCKSSIETRSTAQYVVEEMDRGD